MVKNTRKHAKWDLVSSNTVDSSMSFNCI